MAKQEKILLGYAKVKIQSGFWFVYYGNLGVFFVSVSRFVFVRSYVTGKLIIILYSIVYILFQNQALTVQRRHINKYKCNIQSSHDSTVAQKY